MARLETPQERPQVFYRNTAREEKCLNLHGVSETMMCATVVAGATGSEPWFPLITITKEPGSNTSAASILKVERLKIRR